MRNRNDKLKFPRKLACTSALAIAFALVTAAGCTDNKGLGAATLTDSPSAGLAAAPSGADLMQPDELAKAIQSTRGEKPIVLYVGPRFIWAQAHIPGAEFIGSPANPQSAEKLRARAAAIPHDRPVVIYCGCCPWEHCPNIGPAFQELHKAGLRVRALYLANSFSVDWVAKGFPVAKGNE